MTGYKSAIIGCGAISSIHAEAIAKCSLAELSAVVDLREERARLTAQRYGCDYFTDYKEMLRKAKVDVVHICTPHYLHASMAVDAMKAGKHVLTEKPMAVCEKDAEEAIRTSGTTGMALGVCFQNRYNTTSVKAKEFLASGKGGKVLGAKASVTWNRDAKYYSESGWRGTWDKEGGGVLINQAIHTLDLLQWFMGDIEGIKGSVDTRMLRDVIEVEDTAEATIRFKSGAVAVFYATNCHVKNSPVEIEIVCEKACLKLCEGLEIKYEDGSREHFEDVDQRTGEKSYWGCGHAMLIDDFYRKLKSGEKFFLDGREGLKALKMVESIYRSSRSGEWV